MRAFFEKIISTLEHLSLQSRMWFVFLCLFVAVLFIIVTLARYTLVDHEFYKKLADSQQLRDIELSVNRGTIYASIDPHRGDQSNSVNNTVLATTSISKDLKIDPSAECNLDLAETFLRDIVYTHLCQDRSQLSCFDNVMKYTSNYALPENFDFSRDRVIDFITPTLHEQTHRIYKTRILLASHITQSEADILMATINPGIIIIGDSVYVDPTRFDSSRGVSELISILRIDSSVLESALELRVNRNVDIVDKIDAELALQITTKRSDELVLIKSQPLSERSGYIKKNTISGCLILRDHPIRHYPEGSVTAQIT